MKVHFSDHFWWFVGEGEIQYIVAPGPPEGESEHHSHGSYGKGGYSDCKFVSRRVLR